MPTYGAKDDLRIVYEKDKLYTWRQSKRQSLGPGFWWWLVVLRRRLVWIVPSLASVSLTRAQQSTFHPPRIHQSFWPSNFLYRVVFPLKLDLFSNNALLVITIRSLRPSIASVMIGLFKFGSQVCVQKSLIVAWVYCRASSADENVQFISWSIFFSLMREVEAQIAKFWHLGNETFAPQVYSDWRKITAKTT